MKTRSLVVWAFLLLTAFTALAGSLPNKAPYTNKVTFKSVEPGTTLESALKAAAKAAGVPVLLNGVPEVRVNVDLKGMPFSRFLEVMLKVYAPGLDYLLLPEGVVLVAPKEVVSTLVRPAAKAEEAKGPKSEGTREGEGEMAVVLDAAASGEDLAAAARNLGLKEVAYVPSAKVVLVRGSPDLLERAVPLLREVEERARARLSPPEKEQPQAPPPPPVVRSVELKGEVDREDLVKLAQSLGVQVFFPAPSVAVLRGEAKAVDEVAGLLKEVAERVKETDEKAVSEPPGEEAVVEELPPGVSPEEAKKLVALLYPRARVEVVGDLLALSLPKEEAAQAKEALPKLLKSLAPSVSDQKGYVSKSYPLFGDPKDLAKGLQTLLSAWRGEALGYRVEVLESQKVALVYGPPSFHQEVVAFLREADPPKAGGEGEKASGVKDSVKVRVQLSSLAPDRAKALLDDLGVKEVSMVAEPEGRALWLEGRAEEVARARKYLEVLDQKPPQVKLAVRIYQVERSALSDLSPQLGLSTGGVQFDLSTDGLRVGYALPASVANLLALRLSALEGKGLAKTLVNTETLAKDGTTSEISSGGSIYVVQQQQSGEDETGTTGASGTTNIEYGLIVRLKPSIFPDKSVEVEASLELGTLPNQGPIPGSIDVQRRKLSATLRVEKGYTGVIGGLIYEEATQGQKGIPLLSEIPLLGELFKTRSSNSKESVLLALISPLEVEVPDLPKVVAFQESSGFSPSTPPPQVPEDPRSPPAPSQGGESPREEEVVGKLLNPSPLLRDYVVQAGPRSAGGLTLFIGGSAGTGYAKVKRVYAGERTSSGAYRVREAAWRSGDALFGNGKVAVLYLLSWEGGEVVLEVEDELGGVGYVIAALPR